MSTGDVYHSTTSTHFSDNEREEGNMDIDDGPQETTGPTFARHKDGGIPLQALTFIAATSRPVIAAISTPSPKDPQVIKVHTRESVDLTITVNVNSPPS